MDRPAVYLRETERVERIVVALPERPRSGCQGVLLSADALKFQP